MNLVFGQKRELVSYVRKNFPYIRLFISLNMRMKDQKHVVLLTLKQIVDIYLDIR